MKNFFIILLIAMVLSASGCQPVHPSVTLALMGDLMLGRGVNPQPSSLDFLSSDISSADLALANLESPLADNLPPTGDSYNLCASSSKAALLAGWGFNLISIANNHDNDCGPNGLGQTQAALQAVGITPIGPGMDPVRLVINGLSLSFLAFDDVSTTLDVQAAGEAIQSERDAGALVIVSIHWGMEYQGGASARQKEIAADLVAAGAALVWGHHPHVLQPADWIMNVSGRSLVIYSLGNSLFDQQGLSSTRQSALVVVDLDAQGVTAARAVPFVIDTFTSTLLNPDAKTDSIIHENIGIP